MTVFQDKDGHWVAIRQFRYPSGAEGFERRVLIKRSQDPFADAEKRDEAERLAAEWDEKEFT